MPVTMSSQADTGVHLVDSSSRFSAKGCAFIALAPQQAPTVAPVPKTTYLNPPAPITPHRVDAFQPATRKDS